MPLPVVNMKSHLCSIPHDDKSEAGADIDRTEPSVLINKYSENHGIWPSLINLLKESRFCHRSLTRTK